MKRSTILVVQPLKADLDEDGDGWIGMVQDEKEQDQLWNEYLRLKRALIHLGFVPDEKENVIFNWEGCNCEGQMLGTMFELDSDDLHLIEEKAKEFSEKRESALAKLTPEEQLLLGFGKPPHRTQVIFMRDD